MTAPMKRRAVSRPKKAPPAQREALHALLQELKFKGMARVLDCELDRVERDGISGVELVHRLLCEQATFERERSLINRVAQARLPWQWTIDTFPFERQSGVNKSQILALADLEFVRRADNLVLIGGTGTGKTGIALGLLRQACVNGWRGRFYNAQALLDELYASLADRTTTKLLTALSRMQPLLIDELGYLNLKAEQVNAFFRLMDQRYGRVSTIITTNLDYPRWYELFNNKPLVDALLDRLQHHCITIHIEGPSLRSSPPENAQPGIPMRQKSTARQSKAPSKAR